MNLQCPYTPQHHVNLDLHAASHLQSWVNYLYPEYTTEAEAIQWSQSFHLRVLRIANYSSLFSSKKRKVKQGSFTTMRTTLRNKSGIARRTLFGASFQSSSTLSSAFQTTESRSFHSTPTNNYAASHGGGSPLLVPLKYKASEITGRPQKAYEIRTYTLNPNDYPAFLALTNEKIHMRLKHSKLLGYWTTELGGINVRSPSPSKSD